MFFFGGGDWEADGDVRGIARVRGMEVDGARVRDVIEEEFVVRE